MQQTHSNIGSEMLRRAMRPWHSYRLWQWQRQSAPRFYGDEGDLPRFVRQCKTTMDAIEWLRLLNWEALPYSQRILYFGRTPVPMAAYVGAFLVKLDQQMSTVSQLRRFLVAHPALVWALGFPLPQADAPYGFDVEQGVPCARHLNRVLRDLPNDCLQRLLDHQVERLGSWRPNEAIGAVISLDTKHILAWVKENNPKEYIESGRFDKTQQPNGDPDCKLGCKRRRNQRIATPTAEAQAASKLSAGIGEFYWGYASGVVATKLADGYEFVLAEITQTFDRGDITYFFPLMAQVERRLGHRPKYGTMDAAFDAFYVYDYFNSETHEGFAAVPLSEKGGMPHRVFDDEGRPLCLAGLSMTFKFTYTDRTTALITYPRAKYLCPLLHPQPTGQTCPLAHKNWTKGGCATTIADTPGARIRHQLDRNSDAYLSIYRQRTAVERIFAQAYDLGIERPKLRNQQAIANLNTLTYLLINLRTLRRIADADARG